MSISVEILARVAEGRLFPHLPYMPPEQGVVPRKMYISEEIHTLLIGPWQDKEWEARCGLLRADLDRFVQGGMIAVAEHPFKRGKSAYMKQLSPAQDEVWEIRSRDPRPALRVMGRFADTDVFIALSCWHRALLLGPESREWRDAIVGSKTDWKNLFPAYEPKSSGDNNVYPTACISNNTKLL